MFIRLRRLAKPATAIQFLIAFCLLASHAAWATTAVAPDGGVVWCNGDTTANTQVVPYAMYQEPSTLTYYPYTIAPDGLGANPIAAWDAWDDNAILHNGNMGGTAETVTTSTDPDDRYAIQLDYWNSIVTGEAVPEYDYTTGAWVTNTTTKGALGYSAGNSCVLFYYNTGNIGQFTITYAASPSQPNGNETGLMTTNPALFAAYPLNSDPPYSGGSAGITAGTPYIAQGGPTGYVSTFKGCSWDSNSCTAGSAVLTASTPTQSSTDWNVFPQLLSDITSIPTTWNITYNTLYGDPGNKDGSHIWDASYDIWFDKNGQTGTGQAPYGNARGQNDGLEIMVWLNSNHSYVDTPGGPTPNVAGYAQPSGWPREQVLINNVVYDVWSSRLNNPYYGYAASTGDKVVSGGAEPYTCTTLPLYNPNTGAAATPATNVTNTNGKTCGTEWNVVSFVATKYNGTDYRAMGMSMDTKVFTDYILGIPDGLWQIVGTPAPRIANGEPDGSLECPTSAMDGQQVNPPANPSACLEQSWWLTSIQSGFEPWEGGNGLQSNSLQAHVFTTSTAVQSGVTSEDGLPTVNWVEPFDVVYSGCTTTAGNTASFTITGVTIGPPWSPVAGVSTTYGPFTMSPVPGTNLFEYTVASEMFPVHGTATINFTSSCGNYSVQIFIDPSGQIFYNDGVTPAQGATVSLLYSPSGSAGGPYEVVPNNNYGLSSDIMAPDDNTVNPMASTKYGAYGWDVAPGYYEVNATLAGCGSVTSPVQQVVNTPITNLDLDLPCAPPAPVAVDAPAVPSAPQTLSGSSASTTQITLNWAAVPPPLNATSWTYTVVETSPTATTIATGLTGTSYTVTGLNPGTNYTFAVEAVDGSGSSPLSETVSVTTQSAPTGACHITYTVESAQPGVSNGLTVNINIQNTGSTTLYPWTLSWTFPGNQQISYAWNTAESQSGENVSLASTASWEAISAGSTLYGAVGFNGSYTGTDSIPTAFYINGQLCQ